MTCHHHHTCYVNEKNSIQAFMTQRYLLCLQNLLRD